MFFLSPPSCGVGHITHRWRDAVGTCIDLGWRVALQELLELAQSVAGLDGGWGWVAGLGIGQIAWGIGIGDGG